jgi:hypothetical protein
MQEARIHNAWDDVAGDVCQALPPSTRESESSVMRYSETAAGAELPASFGVSPEKPMVSRVKEMAAEVRQYTHSAPPTRASHCRMPGLLTVYCTHSSHPVYCQKHWHIGAVWWAVGRAAQRAGEDVEEEGADAGEARRGQEHQDPRPLVCSFVFLLLRQGPGRLCYFSARHRHALRTLVS